MSYTGQLQAWAGPTECGSGLRFTWDGEVGRKRTKAQMVWQERLSVCKVSGSVWGGSPRSQTQSSGHVNVVKHFPRSILGLGGGKVVVLALQCIVVVSCGRA